MTVRPLLLVCVAGLTAPAAGLAQSAALVSRAAPAAKPVRNPAFLRASELLQRRDPGQAPRLLFEWERVPGAREYVLQGRWMERDTWALHTREFRVDESSATAWTAERVGFEVSLPEGAHSWTVVAVFGADGIGDFAHPTHASFDLGGVR